MTLFGRTHKPSVALRTRVLNQLRNAAHLLFVNRSASNANANGNANAAAETAADAAADSSSTLPAQDGIGKEDQPEDLVAIEAAAAAATTTRRATGAAASLTDVLLSSSRRRTKGSSKKKQTKKKKTTANKANNAKGPRDESNVSMEQEESFEKENSQGEIDNLKSEPQAKGVLKVPWYPQISRREKKSDI